MNRKVNEDLALEIALILGCPESRARRLVERASDRALADMVRGYQPVEAEHFTLSGAKKAS
jgi:hypothetical protein